MADMAAYEASYPDWGALHSLAKRAAQETTIPSVPRLAYFNRKDRTALEILGPHWILDHRTERDERTGQSGRIEETDINIFYALMPDGALKSVQINQEIWHFPGDSATAFPVYKDSHYVGELEDSDIPDFDFAKEWSTLQPTPDIVRTGDTSALGHRRGPLLCDSKGAGLSRALEALRTGRQGELPSQNHAFTHEPEIPQELAEALRRSAQAVRNLHRQKIRATLHAAYLVAADRTVKLALVALVIFGLIWALNKGSTPANPAKGFAAGSYSMVAWSLFFALAAGVVIDHTVGRGYDRAFLAGATVGVAVFLHGLFTEPEAGNLYVPFDISMFWVAPLFGIIGYLLSALYTRLIKRLQS